jgi:aldehyde:ferredoxin oxidoreductase
LRDTPISVDPLSPENILTLMVSPSTGAPVSGQSRINANARSPLTGAIGDSQAGGYFPAELKFASFDGIVIRGCSSRPVYLSILEGKAELKEAGHLWGKTTGEVDRQIKRELGDSKTQVLQIGPAAENGVRFASMVNMSNRNNGRTGMGLVMASKNLKAVAVRGTRKVEIDDPESLMEIARSANKLLPANPDMEPLAKYGTASVVLPQNMSGTLPTRNYSEGQFEFAEDISGETLYDTILKKRDTCYACIVRCKRVVEIEAEPYPVNPLYGGPEYETLGTFGSYCGIRDLAAISKANEMCNAYGIDTITAGATIAFAMDCFERGVIGLEQTGGIPLRFGRADAMLETLQQIVTRSGPLGTILADGSAAAANTWGPAAKACLITVKGQEAPAHMPQVKKSLALIYAVNPFGADHQSSEHDWMYEAECSQLYLDRLAHLGLVDPPPAGSFGPEKVRFAFLTQQFYSMLDTLELCQFVFGPGWTLFGPEETAAVVRAVTGWDVSVKELLEVGERRLNMLRQFNAREGIDRKEDRLPEKFFTPLAGTGPSAGAVVDAQDFEAALDLYYTLCGWTREGIPTPEKLTALGLAWTVNPALMPN